MPMFDYDCPDCGEVFDQIVRRASDVPLCPKCSGSRSVRRLSVPSAFLMNGSRPDAPPRPANPMDRYKGVDMSKVPYVTREGAIASHTGEVLVKPNGDPAV